VSGVLFQGLLFGLICWTMVREMRRHPDAGFFRPVLFGFMPILLISVASFTTIQGMKADELAATKAVLAEKFAQLLSGGGAGAAGFTNDELMAISEVSLRLQPAAVCVFWLGLLTLSAMALRKWLVSKGQAKRTQPLSRWRAPYFLIWALLIPLAILLLDQRHWLGEVEAWISDLSQNLALVILSVYLFQGMMVVLQKTASLGLPKPAAILLVISALLAALVPMGRGLGLAFLALGILDTWFDFRKLAAPKTGDSQRSGS
jgi:hypothetical protein